MNLDESQKKKVADWIAAGAKLSEIQNRLASELGLRMTYMETRMLVDDLKLTPKDPEPPKVVAPPQPVAPAPAAPLPGTPPLTRGTVSVSLDQITKPGSMVSGKVTFSDGQGADWHLDQTGRLGLAPKQTGYRPTAADVQQFQAALQTELAKMGI